ncbi:MAG: hypothetical protein A3C36_03900 [Omnitrophica WOR_2 bacterium RIFCSPHIGHO2_02_FULL_52_10]|nr:MAG: hypothetical protein A3C36_03900 [Omnitrophica WOR_2 bacterium RIFCSPHIGHO2_02_FULL_52_10]
MSNIMPFKAVYYNIKKVKDMAKVVSPPYDVISAEEQDRLHNLSPYNFTHIDFGNDLPTDDKTENKYSRAKRTFSEWLAKNVMVQDEKPGIYFYKQVYKSLGQKYIRMGFISLLELEDEGASQVFPHENTHDHAVDDRFKLCDSLKSNLSCIFVCYSDKHRKVEKIFERHVVSTGPIVDVADEDRVQHTLWRLDDAALLDKVKGAVVDRQLFIADGHHRYKVAMEYRSKRMARVLNPNGHEPFNYVMTYFTNMDSRGLQIFPMHRIVKQFPQSLGLLEEFFRIDNVKKREDLPILLARAGRNEHTFGLYTRDGNRLLRLKNKKLIDEYMTDGSREYKNLDATILKSFVFDRVHIPSEDIIYTKDIDQVMNLVDAHQADAGFIMNPVKITELRAIALNGERMPPKTTYFYPKVLSGLTVYKMD